MNAVGWCFVEASIKNSFRTPRCTDKSGQEFCDEWTKLKIRPEERDAWTKLAKRVVTNEQNCKIVQRILMHECGIQENRKFQQSADVSRNQTACSRGRGRRERCPTSEICAKLTASRRLNSHVASWKRVSCEQQLDLSLFEHDQRDATEGTRTPWKLLVDVASKNCVWLTSACPEVPVMSCFFDHPILFEVIRVFSAMRLCLVL